MGFDNLPFLLLLSVNLVLPLYFVFFHDKRSGMIEINHITLFSLGFVLYWISPLAVGAIGLFQYSPGMPTWYEIFSGISESRWILYLIISLCCYLSFVAGAALPRKMLVRSLADMRIFSFNRRLLGAFFIPAVLIALAYMILVKDELFRGYQGSIYEEFGWRGSFTASSLLLLVFVFLYIVKLEHHSGSPVPFIKMVRNRYFLVYFIFALLILSMGGRLYFVSSLLMFLVYRTVYVQRIARRYFLILLVALALGAGMSGQYRVGMGMTMGHIANNIFSEFLFAGFSLIHFLRDGFLDLINYPTYLISDFINLVPSFLFPDKLDVLVRSEARGYVIFSPGGALNSFFSFMVNFGIIGTFFVLFCFGIFLNFLKQNGHALPMKVSYIMLCGWVAFSFFRDPFSITIVKLMVEFSIIVPLFLIFCMHLFSPSMRTK